MKNYKLSKIVKISMLSVIGLMLMFVEMATPFFPPFLKFDISDLPALIGAFALGPWAGVMIELLKNVLHGVFGSSSAFVGEMANFLVGSVFVFVAGSIYNKNKNKKTASIGLVVGSIAMTIAASLLNYFMILPLYEKVLNFPISAVVAMGNKVNANITDLNSFIIWCIAPFNLIKCALISALTMVVYKRVSVILNEETSKNDKLAKNN